MDSIVEGLRLRKEGVKNPIFVLGATLPSRLEEAAKENIIITVSNFEILKELNRIKKPPVFHVKMDTGMHRQGFLSTDIPKVLKLLKSYRLRPQGIYTHFAAAKDAAYPTYTLEQLKKFNRVVSDFRKAGFSAKGGSPSSPGYGRAGASGGKNLIRHAAASGGALLFPEAHLDMVRIGMGLYGYWPSPEAQIAKRNAPITLRPVLTWKTVVSETKEIPRDSFVGYDLTERVPQDTKIAVLPVGYWHGYDRGLSGLSDVLVRGRRVRVLGRVSMDMIVVDVTKVSKVKAGDEVTLVGRSGKEVIWADELALKIGTSQYEFLTRINPLIKRFIV